METIILIPDSFKGTLSSTQVCAAMERAILRRKPGVRVISIPVADGGEGYYVQGVHKDTVPALCFNLLGGKDK